MNKGKVIYTYNKILLSLYKKEGNLAICNSMDKLEDTMLSAIRQS
jgi:hypothetical protein